MLQTKKREYQFFTNWSGCLRYGFGPGMCTDSYFVVLSSILCKAASSCQRARGGVMCTPLHSLGGVGGGWIL